MEMDMNNIFYCWTQDLHCEQCRTHLKSTPISVKIKCRDRLHVKVGWKLIWLVDFPDTSIKPLFNENQIISLMIIDETLFESVKTPTVLDCNMTHFSMVPSVPLIRKLYWFMPSKWYPIPYFIINLSWLSWNTSNWLYCCWKVIE